MKSNHTLAIAAILLALSAYGCDDSSKKTADKTCPDRQEICASDNECHDLQNDKNHCGKCDEKCLGDKVCNAGKCEDPAPAGECKANEEKCDDGCHDLNNDAKNCGKCGNDCNKDIDPDAPQKVCNAGKCEDPAPAGECKANEEKCDDGCHDLNNDPQNCGSCGNDCNKDIDPDAPQMVCSNKKCELKCSDEEIICDGKCVDPKTDNHFCGAQNGCSGENAGFVCGDELKCSDSKCICKDTTLSACLGSEGLFCTNPQSDNAHCGCNASSAGLDCSSLPNTESGSCESGSCSITCNLPYVDCNHDASDGCEATLDSVEHCGACDNACFTDNTSAAACVQGVCQIECNADAVMCDDKCAVLDSDAHNCGWCGYACSRDQVCSNGLCTLKDTIVCDANGYIETQIGGVTVKAYCIDSFEKLAAMRDAVNAGQNYPDASNVNNAYILMNDIEIPANTEWVPIGNQDEHPFSGKFLANGKTISGNIRITCNGYTGLFGKVNDAVIQNLNLTLNNQADSSCDNFGILAGQITNVQLSQIYQNGEITCGGTPCGGMIAKAEDSQMDHIRADITLSTMANEDEHGGLIAKAENVNIRDIDMKIRMLNGKAKNRGGLIGALAGDLPSLISNVTISGSLDFKSDLPASDQFGEYIGGLIGYADKGKHVIQNCSSSVNVLVHGSDIGGLIGSANNVDIKNTTVTGNIKCQWECGGFIGMMLEGEISDSQMLGEVTAIKVSESGWNCYIGGFVGYLLGSASVTNSLFDSKISSENSTVGGIVGSLIGKVDHCLVKGTIQGPEEVGGIAGYNSGEISNCVNESNISSSGEKAGGIVGGSSATIHDSISFGNVTCTNEDASSCGGFAGSSMRGTITSCVSFGDVSSKNTSGYLGMGSSVGGFIGSSTADNLSNVYTSGTIEDVESASKFIGYYTQTYTHTPAGKFENNYYWKNASSSETNIISGSSERDSLSGFDYTSNIPVLSGGQKLIDGLGEGWVDVKCDLKSGPGKSNPGEYTIPVPKGVADLVCK